MHNVLAAILVLIVSTNAAAADYEEVRELTLDSKNIDLLNIDNGSGFIDVVGITTAKEIKVIATLTVPNKTDAKARRKIEKDLKLTLEKNGDSAELTAYFEQSGFFNFGSNASVNLEIRLPENMNLFIDDGSGPIEVRDVRGDIELDDGSGSITLVNAGGRVEIDDGSGAIAVSGVAGDVYVNDGSGGIRIRGVAGSVTVDDGSGSIDVHDVEQDLVIVDDGSGGLDFSDIGGRIMTEG